MRILVSWLREFVSFDASVQALADVLTMRGFEVTAIEPLARSGAGSRQDAVLDLEITTNRPDCLSVFGIAREVSTIYDVPLRWPSLDDSVTGVAGTADALPELTVTIEDVELCPRYTASVAEVNVGPSPAWLAARLEAASVRPINNIVDVTNYVMLELGHPMHAFDLNRLAGGALRIRRARTGERVRTLDGQDRALDDNMLVIADAERPQAVAGIMGGVDSEVGTTTHRVAFESAYFQPNSVRRTSKRLGLSTDASYRFERGADIDAPVRAMQRARALLTQIGTGRPRGAIVDHSPTPATARHVVLRHTRIGRILGVNVDATFVPKTLGRLGFTVQSLENANESMRWRVGVPTHRVDISREIDLIEEIARHHGYERLPSTFPAMVRPPATSNDGLERQRLMRRVLTASGCSEAITYGFIERAAAAPFVENIDDLVTIANPLSEKFDVLRPSLLPGLLDSLIWNSRRAYHDVRLFEIGHRFHFATGESATAAIVLTGAATPVHWSGPERVVDLFDIKGIVERLCEALGVTPLFEQTHRGELVHGRAATIRGRTSGSAQQPPVDLGYLGQLVPMLAEARGLPASGSEIYVAEIDVDAVNRVAVDRTTMHVEPLPRHPSIVRDLAIVVDATLPAATVRGTIQTAAPDSLISVHEFDRYEGSGVPDGHVSLAFRLTFRAHDRTLTDLEVQETMQIIAAALEQTHQAIRR